MDTKTQDAIDFVKSLRCATSKYGLNPKEARRQNDKLDNIAFMLDRLEKYEKIWNLLNYRFGGVCLDNSYSSIPENRGIVIVQDLMNKVKDIYFPKPESKHQRLNEVIDRLGIYMQVGKMSEIIESLMKLRDEEEDA